ncbi:MAG: SDR family NAD(P)-dependent oxidoreductase, partial [Elusimicrobiota bacterium]|nr:SDR family NAD(P)-dependent oxidoreductase [Elusimicrobiota bacterium]
MSVLITGGAGFIGSNLADAMLKNGEKVIAVDNFNNYYDPALKEKNVLQNLNNPNYKLYRIDICDGQALEEVFSTEAVESVVHLAASAGVRFSIDHPQTFINTNISGTLNVLECMKKHNVKKIVFASSSSVYGNCKAGKFSEDLKISEPISPYAMTKSACEQLIYTYSALYGISAIILRFFTVYGRRQRPDLAIRKFIELIKAQKEIPVYGDGSTLRDYTYIDDIVGGIRAAVKYNKTSYEIINLGGGSPITLNEMIETIEAALGMKAIKKILPKQKG